MIRVLVVDDSALMRRQLRSLLESHPDFAVETARNGREAVEANRRLLPDVITLDINMPEMDGLSALAIIMAERPVPVVMVSSLTERGAMATLEALHLGAVDFITKPGGTISPSMASVADQLVEKVRSAARARLRRAAPPAPPTPAVPLGRPGLVLIGVSTGGPRTLESILPRLSAQFPWPILVAQHMPPLFSRTFAQRMDGLCALRVVEVDRPLPVTAGTVYIGRGDADLELTRRQGQLWAVPKPPSAWPWHPSAEALGQSALRHCPAQQLVAVLLTGMGHDGAEAFAEIHRRGGYTIAESQRSAVVFGMPAALIERGGASVVLDAEAIADHLMGLAGATAGRAAFPASP